MLVLHDGLMYLFFLFTWQVLTETEFLHHPTERQPAIMLNLCRRVNPWNIAFNNQP